jgi:hypothetical protein
MMETTYLLPRILAGARVDGVPANPGDLFLSITTGNGKFQLVKAHNTATVALRALTVISGEIITSTCQYGIINARRGGDKSLLQRIVDFNHQSLPTKVVAVHRLSNETMSTTVVVQQMYEVSTKHLVAEVDERMKLGLAAAKAGIAGVRVKATRRI